MTFLLVKSRIWEIFLLIESKFWAMETGILPNGPGITLKVGIQDPLSQTKNSASSTWNVESKTVLDSLFLLPCHPKISKSFNKYL